MKTIEERAEENSKKYGPEWGDFTRKEIYEGGYIQGAKEQEEIDLDNFAKFLTWVNDSQPLTAKNQKIKNLIRSSLVIPTPSWEEVIKSAYKVYKEEEK